jgi:phage gp36-like protein
MGRYISWADVTNKYKDFAKGPDATLANSLHVPQAEAEIDGRLAVKYAVPFSAAPNAPYLVQDLCIDLAYYKASIRQESSKLIKEYIDQRIEAIINGTLLLTTSAGPVAASGNFAWASNSYHSSVGPDSEVNWRVDSSWITYAQGARGQY